MGATAFAIAAAIGFALGLLGGGGSILVVPALTYLLGFDTKQAVVTSLAVVGLAAAAGAAWNFSRGALAVAPALVVGSTMMVGAYGGALIGARLPDWTQMAILAVVMLGAAGMMFYRTLGAGHEPAPAAAARPAALAGLGIALGIVTGMVGIGGGFLIVPALVLAGGLAMRAASSSSLLAIAMATAAGLAGYAGRVQLPWGFVFGFAAIASAGTITGGLVADRLPQRYLQRIFAVALVAIAVFMLTRG